jgi:hypothetical protein
VVNLFCIVIFLLTLTGLSSEWLVVITRGAVSTTTQPARVPKTAAERRKSWARSTTRLATVTKRLVWRWKCFASIIKKLARIAWEIARETKRLRRRWKSFKRYEEAHEGLPRETQAKSDVEEPHKKRPRIE